MGGRGSSQSREQRDVRLRRRGSRRGGRITVAAGGRHGRHGLKDLWQHRSHFVANALPLCPRSMSGKVLRRAVGPDPSTASADTQSVGKATPRRAVRSETQRPPIKPRRNDHSSAPPRRYRAFTFRRRSTTDAVHRIRSGSIPPSTPQCSTGLIDDDPIRSGRPEVSEERRCKRITPLARLARFSSCDCCRGS
jgi:hypothetical protein